MPHRKKEQHNPSDASRKRPMRNQQQSEQDAVVISDSDDEESDFRPSSSAREERKKERCKVRPKDMTEEEMLELAMKLSEQEASNTALRQRQEEEAVRKAIAQSLSADSPTQPCPQLSPGHSPSEGIPTVQPSRRRLSYPDQPTVASTPSRLGVRRKMKRKREGGSPLAEMPDLSQSQRDCSQSQRDCSQSQRDCSQSQRDYSQSQRDCPQSQRDCPQSQRDCPQSQRDCSQSQRDCSQTSAFTSTSQTQVFVGLADSQLDPPEGGASSPTERNAAAGPAHSMMAGPAHSTVACPAHNTVAYPAHNTQGHDSDSAPQTHPSPTLLTLAPPTPKPMVILPRLSQDMLSDYQNSGFLRCASEPGTSQTYPLKSLQPSLQPSLLQIYKTPVTRPGKGGEEEEEDLKYSHSPVFSGTNQRTGGGEGGGRQAERPEKEGETWRRKGADSQGCEDNRGGEEEEREEKEEEDSLDHSRSPSFPTTNQRPSLQNPQNSRSTVSSPAAEPSGDVEARSSPGSVPQQSHSQQPRAGRTLNRRRLSGGQESQMTHTSASVHASDCGEPVCVTSSVPLEKMATPAKLALEEELELESQALVAALGSQSVMELTSDMTLRWSDEEEEPTNSAGSPSPVFPKEGILHSEQQSTSPDPHHSTSALSPGPVSQKRSLTPGGVLHEEEGCVAKRARRQCASTGAQGDGRCARSGDPVDGPAVTYYWGVPFCPRGENPDTYTQVILCQLEVYEKSLKEAQHGLYRKAEWGPPVLPGAPQRPRVRGKRHSATPLLEQREEEEEEEEEDEEGGEREKKGAKERGRRGMEDKGRRSSDETSCDALLLSSPEQKEKSPSPLFDSSPELIMPRRRPGLRRGRGGETTASPLEEPRGGAGTTKQRVETEEEEEGKDNRTEENEDEEGMEEEEEPGSSVVCPESQLSDDDITQDLMITSPAEQLLQAESQVLPRIQSFLPGQPQPLPQPQPKTQQQLEGMEVEEVEEVEEEMDGSGPTSPAKGEDEDVRMEEEEEEQMEEQEEPPASPRVDCPMCMAPFPLGEIEMHAAYCDGTSSPAPPHSHRQRQPTPQQVSLKPRRKRTRKGEIIGVEQPSSSSSAKEKCFICQRVFPVREYNQHVEDCIQKQRPDVNLLSALEQSESRDSVTTEDRPRESTLKAKPSQTNSRPHHDNDDDEEEEGGTGDAPPAFRVSTSPIRAFTPISEASNCLIDFTRQYSDKPPSQRGARKRRYKR